MGARMGIKVFSVIFVSLFVIAFLLPARRLLRLCSQAELCLKKSEKSRAVFTAQDFLSG
jgi:hypothetical protein